MKHAQSVHALKIYLERGPFSSGITEVNCYSEKQPASSEKSNIASYFTSVENSKYDTEMLSHVPQESVGLNRSVTFMLKDSLSSVQPVLPACNADVAAEDQFNNSELLQSSLSENVENMPTKAYTRQTKSLSAVTVGQISGDLTLERTCSESCVEDTENIVEKCCSSVLPKKRKRHMETKHGSSRKRAPVVSSGPTSIYIDLEPGSEGQSFRASLSHDAVQDTVTASEAECSNMPWPGLRRRSVIIQPGMTLSIPVSHASVSLAPSFNYPITADCVATTYSTSSHEQKSTAEQHLQASDMMSSMCTGAETVSYQPVQELTGTTDEQKNITDGSLHDMFLGEEQDYSKTVEHKRRRYPTSRPFKCDQCDNAFNQRIHLKKHQSKHTGNVVSIAVIIDSNCLVFLYCKCYTYFQGVSIY